MYGNDAKIAPSAYPHSDGSQNDAIVISNDENDTEGDTDASQQAVNEMLSPLMGTGTGGQYANDGITGANSPLTQGTI